jgi:glycosyltransferase involved in cell wall biosynthesis
MPVVSVVMAVRDGEEYLREAVDSILEQTLDDIEFIVIDDGSTDGTEGILNSYDDPRLRVFRQSGCGCAPSLNAGIRHARAPLIARMDADDISQPSRLERQASFLSQNRNHVLVGSDVLVISEEGEILHCAQLVTDNAEIQHCLERLVTPFYHGAVMFRRDAVIECGLYDERIPNVIDDMLLWFRLRHLGPMANLPETLYRYRYRARSVSRLPRDFSKTKSRILRDYASNLGVTSEDIREFSTLYAAATERRSRATYELDLGKIYLDQAGNLPRARQHLARAVLLAPASPRAWFNLALSLSPRAVRSWRIRKRNRRIHLRAGAYR